jgi:hypothetical protein
MIFSKKGELAIEPVFASKVEIDAGIGFSRATARSKVIYAKLVFSYEYNGKIFEGGKAHVILPGEAAHAAWAKKEYELDGVVNKRSFVICPESIVLGFDDRC